MNLLRIIPAPHKWTQNAAARDKNGDVYPTTFKYDPGSDYTKGINSLSIYGALTFYGGAHKDKYASLLRKAIGIYTGKSHFIAEFNDLPTTTYDDIVAVAKIANKLNK